MKKFEQIKTNVSTPGKMGWNSSVDDEDKIYESMAGDSPDRFESKIVACGAEGPAKDSPTFKKILEWQDDLGIEDGIDLSMIEYWITGNEKWLPWKRQIIGSCVASGGMRAYTYRMMWEVLVFGQLQEVLGRNMEGRQNLSTFGPYNYVAGRSRNGLIGRGDGSTCGAHIKGFLEDGALSCDTPGLQDYTQAYPEPQSGSTYRRLGNSRDFLNKFRQEGQKLLMERSVRIRDEETARLELIENFCPFMICSGWGFGPTGTVLQNGLVVYRRSGSWSHNMTIVGIMKIGGNWYVKVKNSWGMTAHRNGDYFIITLSDFLRWLQSASCMSIGEIRGRSSSAPEMKFPD